MRRSGGLVCWTKHSPRSDSASGALHFGELAFSKPDQRPSVLMIVGGMVGKDGK
jgi:hypothetical protein